MGSLAPICYQIPEDRKEFETIGCLPKCLENGEWSTALPTCEKDWCNPIFEEWHCCKNRADEVYGGEDENNVNQGVAFLEMDYYVEYHDLRDAKCPLGYGDCDRDSECHHKRYSGDTVCSQQRDLNKIDVCIEDIDPCDDTYASGVACMVLTAVGVDYKATVKDGSAASMFVGGSFMIMGVLLGYHFCKKRKGGDYQPLLEEEI